MPFCLRLKASTPEPEDSQTSKASTWSFEPAELVTQKSINIWKICKNVKTKTTKPPKHTKRNKITQQYAKVLENQKNPKTTKIRKPCQAMHWCKKYQNTRQHNKNVTKTLNNTNLDCRSALFSFTRTRTRQAGNGNSAPLFWQCSFEAPAGAELWRIHPEWEQTLRTRFLHRKTWCGAEGLIKTWHVSFVFLGICYVIVNFGTSWFFVFLVCFRML